MEIAETENQWRVRIKEPNTFQKGSFRTKDLGHGVSIIIGKLKGSMVTQSYHFSKDQFKTKKEVQAWLKKNKVSHADYLKECLNLLAQEIQEEFGPTNVPQKPTDGCPSGYQRDPKTKKCKKMKVAY